MMINKRTLYLILVLFIFIIMFIPNTRRLVYGIAGDFFYPFISMVSNIGNYVDKKSDLRKSKAALIDEIQGLREKNVVLLAKSRDVDLLKKENRELHRLLKLKNSPYYRYVFAEIISRDPIKWFQEFVINKGRKDGLENGSLIIARINNNEKGQQKFGVIGRVSAVSGHSAVVDTIINKDSRLSVIIPENGSTGILKGGGRSGNKLWTKVVYLPRDLVYKSGSEVKTSGLNDFIPPSLLVGTIKKEKNAIKRINNLYTEVKVTPAVDFNHIKYVLALVKHD